MLSRSGGLLPLAHNGRKGLLSLLIGQDHPVGQLAEVLSDKSDLRVGRTPHEFASLLDDALVILADDVGRVRIPERVGHSLFGRGDEQDARATLIGARAGAAVIPLRGRACRVARLMGALLPGPEAHVHLSDFQWGKSELSTVDLSDFNDRAGRKSEAA